MGSKLTKESSCGGRACGVMGDSAWAETARADCCSSVPPHDSPTPDTSSFLCVGFPADSGRILADQGGIAGYRCWLVDCFESLATTTRSVRPTLAALFLDVDPELRILRCMRRLFQTTPVVAITDSPSLLRASAAVRSGAHAVLARPTSFSQIVAALGPPEGVATGPMSLDRAIWSTSTRWFLRRDQSPGRRAGYV